MGPRKIWKRKCPNFIGKVRGHGRRLATENPHLASIAESSMVSAIGSTFDYDNASADVAFQINDDGVGVDLVGRRKSTKSNHNRLSR